MFLEQARPVLTQRRYNLNRTSHNTKEHETRRGSHGKKRDDKVQQKGRGVTASKGNAEESGNGPSPAETAAPDHSGCRLPCSILDGREKSHPEEGHPQPGGPTGSTPQVGESQATGKSLDRQKKGEKQRS